MDKVDIKIGNNTYLGVSVINVDKANGGSANFIYNGIISDIKLSSKITSFSLKSVITDTIPLITSKITIGG